MNLALTEKGGLGTDGPSQGRVASGSGVRSLRLPVGELPDLSVGDRILVSGKVFAGRDAVLPKVCQLIRSGDLASIDADLNGAGLLHSAVSPAGIGPTSSNKAEIEESFGPLCEAGIRVFLGKGRISEETVRVLGRYGACFAVVPPVTALLGDGLVSVRVAAHPELGMEALYEMELSECPAIVASVGGKSIF